MRAAVARLIHAGGAGLLGLHARGAGLILLLGVGCRPPTEPERSGALTVTPSQSEREPGSIEGDPPSEPPHHLGWSSTFESSPCELACADVYACSLFDGDERSAVSIELGCLDACVRAPLAFAACRRPNPIAAEACVAYLSCARAAWPTEERPSTIVDVSREGRDGCDIACRALARCRGFPDHSAEQCSTMCRVALDRGQQQVAAGCGDLETCSAIESCVTSLPGAT